MLSGLARAWTHGVRAFVVVGCAAALLAPGFFPDDPISAAGTNYHGSLAAATIASPIVDMASTASGGGYWLVEANGAVHPFGDAKFHGGADATPLQRAIVGMAATANGAGYWLVASDGGIFSYGNARFLGGTGGIRLNQPIVGMAATPSGNGYWLVASDGGIFSYGDAQFFGSTGAIRLNSPIVGMASTATGRGYWLAAADGGIFGFGDAKFFGSMGGQRLVSPVTGIAAPRDGGGYWLVAEDGGIFNFGTARFLGSGTGAPPQTTVDLASSPGGGYWMATTFGAVHVATEGGVFLVDPDLAKRMPAESIASELAARINAERRARGQAALGWHPQLAATAQAWANHLAATGAFQHQNLGAVLNSYGGTFVYLAENIYMGTGGASDSGSAHAALMRSDPHRATMFTAQLQYVGVGVACVGNKVVVVEDFSIGAGSPTPGAQGTPPPTPFVSADEAGTGCG